jgi:predicted nucleic acid-binding protein
MLVVDTCVLIDIADDDPDFGEASADCLARRLDRGLTVSPITYVELAPAFDGSRRLLDEFLDGLGVGSEGWEVQDRDNAFAAWAKHVSARRARKSVRRPVADVLIGALAMRCGGLITRNGGHFTQLYPRLRIVEPQFDGG